MFNNNFMEVILGYPIGFCEGVKRAFKIAEKARNENPNKDIYLLGSLVHNEKVIRDLELEGFHLISFQGKELEKAICTLSKGSVVIFSAHGHPSFLEDLAKERDLIIYDATCSFVKYNESLIKEAISQNKEVIYIGVKGHAESEAALSISDKVHLATKEGFLSFPSIDSDILVVSQTTMSSEDLLNFEKLIKEKFPLAKFASRRCLDASKRQESALLVPINTDLIIVLGSKTSNNSQKLRENVKKKYPNIPSFLVLSPEEVPLEILKNSKKCYLLSGASTSMKDVLETKGYLESLVIK